MRVYVFCQTDFSQYPPEMEDCFSADAFSVLENAVNVCNFTACMTIKIYCNVYFFDNLQIVTRCYIFVAFHCIIMVYNSFSMQHFCPDFHAMPYFQWLNPIWSGRSISNTVKFFLYSMIVLSTAHHACETWKSTAHIWNTLDVFHQRCIQKILRVLWRHRMTNGELMRRSEMQSVSKTVKTRRLRLAGHVLRQPKVRPANVAMNWIPEDGKRSRGRPRKTMIGSKSK